MTHLNLEEALECAKNGEEIYANFDDFDIENKYFTMGMLVDGIIEYYSFNYKHRTNIDSNLEGWVGSIIEYVELYEKDYKEWWKKINDEENDEDIDDKYDKMDEYFNKEYVATEIFPRTLGRKIGILKQIREESDYDDFYIASRDEALEQIETAEIVLQSIKEYLAGNIE